MRRHRHRYTLPRRASLRVVEYTSGFITHLPLVCRRCAKVRFFKIKGPVEVQLLREVPLAQREWAWPRPRLAEPRGER